MASVRKVQLTEPKQTPQPSHDISVPAEFKDFTKVLKTLKIRDFLNYLIQQSCPFQPNIRESLVPKKYTKDDIIQAIDTFLNMFKTSTAVFMNFPNYSVMYICGLLSSVNSTEKNTILAPKVIDFLGKFIKLRIQDFEEEILEIILPTFLFNLTNDSPPVRKDFVLLMCDLFGVNILLTHFLNFFDSVNATNSMVTRFHISLMTNIAEQFALEEKLLKRAKEFAVSLLGGQSEQSARLLVTTLDECDVDENPNTNNQNPKLSPRGSLMSPRSVASKRSSFHATSPSSKSISPEILDDILDMVEMNTYTNAFNILNDVRAQLERLKEFPKDRKIDPLIKLALTTYSKPKTTPEEQKSIYLLMTSINTNVPPDKMLKIYLECVSNEKYPHDFLEQCYQHFLKTSHAKERLPSTTIIPVSLVSANDGLNPRKDIEFAFTCLNQWQSSYDGVKRVWELLKNEPDTDISEYFDPLIFTQKSFLVEGLRNHMAEEQNEPQMKGVIDALDNRMMNETKSDRVAREAHEVSEKMNELIVNETKYGMIPHNSSTASLSSMRYVSASSSMAGNSSNIGSGTQRAAALKKGMSLRRSAVGKEDNENMDETGNNENSSSTAAAVTTGAIPISSSRSSAISLATERSVSLRRDDSEASNAVNGETTQNQVKRTIPKAAIRTPSRTSAGARLRK